MKKAILVVSFGTSYEETRKKTIEAIEQNLFQTFPDYEAYRAWTSPRILAKVRKSGFQIDSLEEALHRMKTDGIEEILIQPTFMLHGVEYDRMISCIKNQAELFQKIHIGSPMMSTEKDLDFLARTLQKILPEPEEQEQIFLMGHGTPEGDNACYRRLNELFQKAGSRITIGLVEAEPDIKDLMEKIKDSETKKIVLSPFMIVAGDHALHDMSGDAENCWQKLLEKDGYKTKCILKGMGEYPEIRKLYIQHAEDAEEWKN